MMEVMVATEIEASAETVWNVLTELDEFHTWNPFIREAHGSTAVGGEISVRVHPSLAVTLPFHATVVAREDRHELRWRGQVVAPWLAAGDHTFTIEPLDAHRVRFIQRERFTGVLPWLASALLARETARGFEAMNHALDVRARAREARS